MRSEGAIHAQHTKPSSCRRDRKTSTESRWGVRNRPNQTPSWQFGRGDIFGMLGGKKFHPEAQTNNSHSDAHNQRSRQQTTLWVLCRWHRRLKKWWKKGFEWQEWHPSRSSGALLATLSRNKSKLSFFKPDLGNLLGPNASQRDRKKLTIQGPIIRQTEKNLLFRDNSYLFSDCLFQNNNNHWLIT